MTTKYVTKAEFSKWLEVNGACREARAWVSAQKTMRDVMKCPSADWGRWLLERIKGPAWAEYERIVDSALAEYERIKGPALAEYKRIADSAWAEYERIEGPAWAEYARIKGSAVRKALTLARITKAVRGC